MVPPAVQRRVLSCYVLQHVRPIEMHKPLTQRYLINDPYMQINEIFEIIAFCIQKQASS